MTALPCPMRLNSLPIREVAHYEVKDTDGELTIWCKVCGHKVGYLPWEVEYNKLARREWCNRYIKRHFEFSPSCIRFRIADNP